MFITLHHPHNGEAFLLNPVYIVRVNAGRDPWAGLHRPPGVKHDAKYGAVIIDVTDVSTSNDDSCSFTSTEETPEEIVELIG